MTFVEECNAKDKKEVFTWGGPEATFRIDKVGSVGFKWLSIRDSFNQIPLTIIQKPNKIHYVLSFIN